MKKGPDELVSERVQKKQKVDDYNPFSHPLDIEQRFLNAAFDGDLYTVESLLSQVDVNCTNICNETALMLAINDSPKQAQMRIIRRLLERGADTDIVSIFGETALSRAKKHNQEQVINLLHNDNIAHLVLPNEIWLEIAKYLSPEDLENFKLICQAFNSLYHKNTDLLWQPLLNRLHAIDSTIKATMLPGKTIRETFIKGFFKVHQRQKFEIEKIYEYHEDKIKELNIHFNIEQKITLDLLEEQNKKLDDINCMIIQSEIDQANGSELNLFDTSITRLPKSILTGKNASFFNKLEELILMENELETIPDNIDVCTNLKTLSVAINRIVHLPQSICHLKTLESLYCHDNSLTQLPEQLGKLGNLTSLHCEYNYITHLPKSIGQLTKLTELGIRGNYLYWLPESMIYIMDNLTNYDFSSNPFCHDLENTHEDGMINDYYLSFIDADESAPDSIPDKIRMDNLPNVWLPLINELETIEEDITSNNKEGSLRQQFINHFKQIANRQLRELLELSINQPHIKTEFNIEQNQLTGEYRFTFLTVDALIKQQDYLYSISSDSENDECNSAIEFEMSQSGLFHQFNMANVQNQEMDRLEPSNTPREPQPKM